MKPAFPFNHPNEAFQFPNCTSQGMSLREWYAGQALMGLCANTAVVFGDHLGPEHPEDCKHSMAVACFRIADAMIQQTEQQ